jgi:phosphate transport system substrate-binding protein
MKLFTKKITFLILCFISSLIMNNSCINTKVSNQIIKIKGSETMILLMENLSSEYMNSHTGIAINVEGGGSESGINALINKQIDICMSSRKLNNLEIDQITKANNKIPISHLIAKDAIVVYVNSNNPVSNISEDEFRKIFTGEITNWKQLGGKDDKIDIILRYPNSGTFSYVRKFLLENKQYPTNAIIKSTFLDLESEVEKNPKAISFGGIKISKNIKILKVNNYLPSYSNELEEKYPFVRYLYLYTIDYPEASEKDFIEWIMSDECQRIIKELGYLPIWKNMY